jgi:hypothetical protein
MVGFHHIVLGNKNTSIIKQPPAHHLDTLNENMLVFFSCFHYCWAGGTLIIIMARPRHKTTNAGWDIHTYVYIYIYIIFPFSDVLAIKLLQVYMYIYIYVPCIYIYICVCVLPFYRWKNTLFSHGGWSNRPITWPIRHFAAPPPTPDSKRRVSQWSPIHSASSKASVRCLGCGWLPSYAMLCHEAKIGNSKRKMQKKTVYMNGFFHGK